MTAPELFALASGVPLNYGEHRCFYCGCPTDESFPARRYVADSFTERDAVACPGSKYVCGGCVQCLRSDLGSVPLIDGATYRSKADGKRKPREGAEGVIQMRWFSWVLTREKALGATPAHRELLNGICLAPPEPPFAICIADGNKHQLFRTPVCHSLERVSLNCEGTRVECHPEDLRDRLQLVMRLVAVVGKGADSLKRLMDPMSEMNVVLQLANHYDDAGELFQAWRAVRCEPTTNLAIWLAPGKQEASECITRTAAAGAV
jgi:hypothetical protein